MFNKKEVDEIRNLLKGLPLLNDKDKIRRVNKAKKDFVFSAILYTIVFSSFSLLVRF